MFSDSFLTKKTKAPCFHEPTSTGIDIMHYPCSFTSPKQTGTISRCILPLPYCFLLQHDTTHLCNFLNLLVKVKNIVCSGHFGPCFPNFLIWKKYTFPKINMEPENDGFQKESSLQGSHFQVLCLFWGVYTFQKTVVFVG